MDWSDVVDVIKKVAPTAEGLLSAFGGPPGMIAAGAIKAAAMAFGLSETAKPDELVSAIANDPQAALKLALADQDFKLKMREQDIEEIKTKLVDVQNARNMNVEGVKATGKRDVEDKVFDWFLIIGFFTILGLMLWLKPPESTNLGLMIGAVIMAFGQVVNFRKGTTVNSSRKTELLAKAEPIF
ncbi:MAG: hypothetical protein AB1401_00570 [Thermodesulfobacteriota bacterium]